MTVNRKTKLFTVAILLALVLPMVLSITPALACEPCQGPGTGTPGYYKKADHWPVLPSNPECGDEPEIDIGGECYTPDEAIEWLKKPVKGDKSITMFKAVVAAMLNVIAGNCGDCVDVEPHDWIGEGRWWLTLFPVGSDVRANTEAWQASHGEQIYWVLDDYNNGLLCAQARD